MGRGALTQPACGNDKEHSFHEYEWMDHNFDVQRVWCNGVCLCGLRKKAHGPGAHK